MYRKKSRDKNPIINKTQEMEFTAKKEPLDDTGVPLQKDVVIPDECGDSLWDAVLEQDFLKDLPDKKKNEDKELLKDGNLDKQANSGNETVIPNANP